MLKFPLKKCYKKYFYSVMEIKRKITPRGFKKFNISGKSQHSPQEGKYYWIILAETLVQATAKMNICTKFDENW